MGKEDEAGGIRVGEENKVGVAGAQREDVEQQKMRMRIKSGPREAGPCRSHIKELLL